MSQVWTIARREYRTRITSPLFIVLTLLTFVLLVGGPVAGVMLLGARAARPVTVAVVDRTGWLLPRLQDALDRTGAGAPALLAGDPAPLVLEAAGPDREEELLARARDGKLPALLVLQGDRPDRLAATLSASSAITLGRAQSRLRPVLAEVVQAERLQGRQVDPELLQILREPVRLDTVQLTTGAQAEDYGVQVGLASVFNLLMYMGILLYAALTFQGVLEEKASRVMEVLVAAVKPDSLMAGKVLGVGLVGLTQFATWALAYVVLLGLPLAALSTAMARVSPVILVYMLVYFVLGYFLYASLYAAAASTISRMEDSQALMGPLTMLVMAGYLVSTFALQDPNGALARWSSLFPWFAPTVMITRLALGQPPPWEVAVSLGLLLLATAGTVWAAARIYRVGVLLYGARPTWRLIWRYLRTG